MNKQQQKRNALVLYRRRMQLPQKRVAELLGQKNTGMLSHYERGDYLPPLATALALGIIFRVPVEFLFPRLYDSLRENIRTQEAQILNHS